jgi:hypothetical protein
MATATIIGALVYAALAALVASIASRAQRQRRAPQNAPLHL